MNLEEAKKSIGKIVRIDVDNVPETLHLGEQNYKLKYVNDSGLCGLALEFDDMAKCKIHHSNIYLRETTMKCKIGDEVVLRPETKPYTFLNCNENRVKIFGNLSDRQNYSVLSISLDGDLSIGTNGNYICHISPRHVKHAKENNILNTLSVDLNLNDILKDFNMVELRLAILRCSTSRTLQEMKDIEKWILGDE